ETLSQLQLDLAFVPTWTFWQYRQFCETAFEVVDRFKMGLPCGGMLAGFQPFIDCTLHLTGSGQMMRQQFGSTRADISEMLLQHRRDAGMQIPPSCAQQGAVSCILHQRVLERVY